jgi:error-prone DNA polymerase
VEVRRPDINTSAALSDLEPLDAEGAVPTGLAECLSIEQPPIPEFVPSSDPGAGLAAGLTHRRDAGLAVRLGICQVKGIEVALAEQIAAEREANGAYRSLTDLTRRVRLTAPQVEALATAGAFDGLGLSRRQALWGAGQAALWTPGQLELPFADAEPPVLPEMEPVEETIADLWATGMSPSRHPIEHVRADLDGQGILAVNRVMATQAGSRVAVAGLVTHRQRPATASGVTFLNLEDETGMLNVVCSVGVVARYPRVARSATAMIIRGIVERQEGSGQLGGGSPRSPAFAHENPVSGLPVRTAVFMPSGPAGSVRNAAR